MTRVILALLLCVAGLSEAVAVERPVPRPALLAGAEPGVSEMKRLRPTPRPGDNQPEQSGPQIASTGSVEPMEAAGGDALATSVRLALTEAFPGAGGRGDATSDPLVVDPRLARPLPKLRPANLVDVMSSRGGVAVPESAAPRRSVRPVGRVSDADRTLRLVQAAMAAPAPRIAVDGTLLRSERPMLRPQVQLALGRRLATGGTGGGGGICERGSIRGERIAPVPGRGACGIPNAVRVTQVSGVALSRSARMDCGTARALDDWVRKGVLPAVGNHGGGAVRLEVAAGYACRTRNNQPGARISEHGKGRAIDISGIKLANGEVISVLRDWNKGTAGRMLAAMWRAACGPFGTVLGPNSDRFHRDHFHFDTARYRSGSYCR